MVRIMGERKYAYAMLEKPPVEGAYPNKPSFLARVDYDTDEAKEEGIYGYEFYYERLTEEELIKYGLQEIESDV